MTLRTLAMVLLSVVFAVDTLSGQLSSADQKRPLDLPVLRDHHEDEEEDIPEVIRFFGMEYEGNAFIWCLPRFNLKEG